MMKYTIGPAALCLLIGTPLYSMNETQTPHYSQKSAPDFEGLDEFLKEFRKECDATDHRSIQDLIRKTLLFERTIRRQELLMTLVDELFRRNIIDQTLRSSIESPPIEYKRRECWKTLASVFSSLSVQIRPSSGLRSLGRPDLSLYEQTGEEPRIEQAKAKDVSVSTINKNERILYN